MICCDDEEGIAVKLQSFLPISFQSQGSEMLENPKLDFRLSAATQAPAKLHRPPFDPPTAMSTSSGYSSQQGMTPHNPGIDRVTHFARVGEEVCEGAKNRALLPVACLLPSPILPPGERQDK